MYGAMFDGRYYWISDATNNSTVGLLPIFNNFLRKNDKIEPYEEKPIKLLQSISDGTGKIPRLSFMENLVTMMLNSI